MFADDNSLFISDINLDDLFYDMNRELNEISLWFKVNKLSRNFTKNKIFSLSPSPKKEIFKKMTSFLLKG